MIENKELIKCLNFIDFYLTKEKNSLHSFDIYIKHYKSSRIKLEGIPSFMINTYLSFYNFDINELKKKLYKIRRKIKIINNDNIDILFNSKNKLIYFNPNLFELQDDIIYFDDDMNPTSLFIFSLLTNCKRLKPFSLEEINFIKNIYNIEFIEYQQSIYNILSKYVKDINLSISLDYMINY